MGEQAAPTIFGWMGALGEPTRARLLRLVEQQELNVGELSAILALPQSTTSRHLKVLVEDGWLVAQRDGTSRLYRLSEGVPQAKRALWDLVRASLEGTQAVGRDDENLSQVIAQRRSKSQEFFADAAPQWDALREELFGPHLEFSVLSALLPREAVLADLGCGTGRLAELAAPFVRQVIAVDNSEAMLQAAQSRLKRHSNVILVRGSLNKLPIPSQSADLAVLCMVLHYVPEPAIALAEIARVLSPDGTLVIADIRTHAREELRAQMGHVWSGFGEEQLSAWLGNSGFSDHQFRPHAHKHLERMPEIFICNSYKRRTSVHL